MYLNEVLVTILLVVLRSTKIESRFYHNHPIEKEHAPFYHTTELPRDIVGSELKVEDPQATPDFRIEEQPPEKYHKFSYVEEERPYRVSPHYKQVDHFPTDYRHYKMVGCACCTVYKKFQLLAVCCVITTRHVLTTATSTELVLRRRRHFKYLENILGIWYDHDGSYYNSSLYATPARIHYHPHYLRPQNVNRSHPFPVIFDVALWAMTYRFYSRFLGSNVVLCPRAGSHRYEHSSAVPTLDKKKEKHAFTAGFQFMKAFNRKPSPFFKYMVKTTNHIWPCPKVEWGWFHCIKGNWAKLGLDSGAPLFRVLRSGWRYSGLMGINIISMRLRSYEMIHYYQVLESHTILDFIYDAIMGFPDYEWLDYRFYNTKNRSPQPKNDAFIYWNFTFGDEVLGQPVPTY